MSVNESEADQFWNFKRKRSKIHPIQGIYSEVDSDLLIVYEVFVANIIYNLR